MIFGKGINDTKGFSLTKFYTTWQRMLERCYSETYQQKQPTYVGCFVCDEWLTFSKFKAWMEMQDWEGKQLDKDILFPGNKVYSPDTCVFVSQEVNLFFHDNKMNRGVYPIGVSYHKKDKKFESKCGVNGKQVYLGQFDTPEEAHNAWRRKKLEIAEFYASQQKDLRIAKAIFEKYLVS